MVEWIAAQRSHELFLSVITLGEIERGITKQKNIAPAFAQRLASWLERTCDAYSERILPVSADIALRWGQMTTEFGRTDAYVLIAATAQIHGFAVATRNVKHFKPLGVDVVNPFV